MLGPLRRRRSMSRTSVPSLARGGWDGAGGWWAGGWWAGGWWGGGWWAGGWWAGGWWAGGWWAGGGWAGGWWAGGWWGGGWGAGGWGDGGGGGGGWWAGGWWAGDQYLECAGPIDGLRWPMSKMQPAGMRCSRTSKRVMGSQSSAGCTTD